METQFRQPKQVVNVVTNKQSIALNLGIRDEQVCYANPNQNLVGFKAIFDATEQRAYFLPPGLTGEVISLNKSGILTFTDGFIDLGEYAATRGEFFTLQGSFLTGATLHTKNETLLQGSMRYRWDGVLPKTVEANSSPQTEGVGTGYWIPVGVETLRQEFALDTAASMIMEASGITVQQALDAIRKNKILPSMASLSGLVGTADTDTVYILAFHEDKGVGGGLFKWSGSTNKTNHNGGTVIDPARTFPTTWEAADKTDWFTASTSGTGVWVRVKNYPVLLAEFFGAAPWNVGDTHDSTQEFQKAANVASRGGVWRWVARHRIISYVQIPAKQTFGSFSAATSVFSELFQPTNFQGVHVIADSSLARTVQNAVFYDAVSGAAFHCEDGASPTDCMVYGRGYTTTGMNLAVSLPAVGSYYDVAAFRHSKSINIRNVTVALMKYALDSNPWDASKGDYYSTTFRLTVLYSYCISRVPSSQDITFNTKHDQMRAYVNQVGDYAVAARMVTFSNSSIEGYNTPTFLRASSQFAFKNVYFETGDTAFTGAVFSLIGWSTFSMEDCLVYMNNTAQFLTSGGSGQSAGVLGLTVKSVNNVWRKTDSTATSVVYNVAGVTNKTVLVACEVLNPGSGASLGLWAGAVPTGTYNIPITVAF